MKVNQSGIRTAVKFTVFFLFLVGVGWRLYEIIRFGGKKDTSQPTSEDQCKGEAPLECDVTSPSKRMR